MLCMTRLIFWLSGWCLLICNLGREIIFFSGTTCMRSHTLAKFHHFSILVISVLFSWTAYGHTHLQRFIVFHSRLLQCIRRSVILRYFNTAALKIEIYDHILKLCSILNYESTLIDLIITKTEPKIIGYYRNETEPKKIIGRHDRRRRVTGARQSCPKRAIMTTLPETLHQVFFRRKAQKSPALL